MTAIDELNAKTKKIIIFDSMYKAEFEYNANAHRQSMKMFETNYPSAANPAYNLSYIRYYAGEYDKQVSANNTTEVCYINTPVGLAAAHVTQNNTSEIFYLHTDHLGSIIGVSNSNQQKIYEVSYDAWGKKRAVEFWFPTNEPQTPPTWLWRGYTGHEHLPEFGLINMNARLYDPLLGRMLSPDNYITNATYSGDFNRYSYARNNPLKYVDPDGNVPVPVVAMIIGGIAFGYIGGVSSNNGQINPIDWNWAGNGAWKTYTGIGIGITVGVGVGYVTGYAGTKLFAATKGGSKAAISTKTAASLTTAVGFGVGYAGGFVIGYTNGFIYSGGNGEYALENAMTYGIWGSVAGSAIGIITGDLLQMQDYQERQKLIEEQEKIRMQQVGYSNANYNKSKMQNQGSLNNRAIFNLEYLNMDNGTSGYSNVPVIFDQSNAGQLPLQINTFNTRFYGGQQTVINASARYEVYGAYMFQDGKKGIGYDNNRHYFRYLVISHGATDNQFIYGSIPKYYIINNERYFIAWPR